MLTKMQLIISYCTLVKHGFKSKLKHTFITSIPGNLLLMNLNRSVVALSLYLSQRWAVVSIILYVTYCFLKAVSNTYWKNTRRLAAGIYTIGTGRSLFSKEREPHLQCTLGQRAKTNPSFFGTGNCYPPKSHHHKAVCILHTSHTASAGTSHYNFKPSLIGWCYLQVW